MSSNSTNLSFIGLGRFRGHWNASTNVALSGGALFTGSHISGGYDNGNLNLTFTPKIGEYWQVNTAGTTNLNGTNSWQVSDFCVYTTGSKWVKIANSDVLSSIVVGDVDTSALQSSLLVSSSNQQVLFNSGSIISGSQNFTFDYASGILAINALTAHSGNVLIRSGSYLTVTSNATDTASMFFVRSDSGVQIGGGYDNDGLTFDSTGSLKTSGSILISYQTGHRPAHHVRGTRAFTGVNTTDNGMGGVTLSASVLIDGVYFATNKAALQTDTTATAAQIQAAFGNDIRNGDSFTFYYYNLGGHPVTLNGGERVTTAALNATASYTMSASKGRGFIITATDTTPGNEHCIMFPTTDLFNALS